MSESEHIQSSPAPDAGGHVQAAPPHGHGEHPEHSATPAPYSDQELEVFHKEDRMAGGMVICLMAGIFTLGLLLYTAVAIFVVRGA
jgi:hypothetical protein